MKDTDLKKDHVVSYLGFKKLEHVNAKGLSVLEAIRFKCIDCSNGSISNVKSCVISDCCLYPFRMGCRPTFEGDPPKRAMSAERLATLQSQLQLARLARFDSDPESLDKTQTKRTQAPSVDLGASKPSGRISAK
jgi:hypothetical protein